MFALMYEWLFVCDAAGTDGSKELYVWVNHHGYVILDNSRENYLDWGETATRILVDNGIRLEGTYRDVWDYLLNM